MTTVVTATATLWLTGGLTFYGGDFVGQGLACGGQYVPEQEEWVAMPIEWFMKGYISCGDVAHVRFRDGTTWEGPVLDSGCLLHYEIFDTGLPFVGDFPVYLRQRLGPVPTGTGQIAVWRKQQGRWWDVPPLDAWGTKWCHGPLTMPRPRNPRWTERNL